MRMIARESHPISGQQSHLSERHVKITLKILGRHMDDFVQLPRRGEVDLVVRVQPQSTFLVATRGLEMSTISDNGTC